MMFESLGSIATQQSVNAPPSSKIGTNEIPRLIVFHRPPKAVATYQTFGSFGSICTSAMRPLASAGPRLRSSSPFSAPAVSGASVAFWRAPAAAEITASAARTTNVNPRVMDVPMVRGEAPGCYRSCRLRLSIIRPDARRRQLHGAAVGIAEIQAGAAAWPAHAALDRDRRPVQARLPFRQIFRIDGK